MLTLTRPAYVQTPDNAQIAEGIPPTGQGAFQVESRDPEEIQAFQPVALAHPATSFRPPMGEAAYKAAKRAASGAVSLRSTATATTSAAVTGPITFAGGTQSDNASVGQPAWYPANASGAAGTSHFVQVNEAYMRVYSKKTGALLTTASLQALMKYSTTYLHDGRVLWDPIWSRWVVSALADPESSDVQKWFFAVSKSSSATGGWWVFNTNVLSLGVDLTVWDSPSIGMDQDALIFTANVWGPASFLGSSVFTLAKAQYYSGRPHEFRVFGGLRSTLRPPIVTKRDTDRSTWLAAAWNGNITLYAMRETSRPEGTQLLSISTEFFVGYDIPPDAEQPSPCTGARYLLDTLDARFAPVAVQSGERYYLAHSIAYGGRAAVRYYVFRHADLPGGAVSLQLEEQSTFYSSPASSDFNPSIAANDAGDVVLTWSRSDSSTFPEVRVVGRSAGSAPITGTGGSQITVAGSSTCLTGNLQTSNGPQLWGTYSQVTLDPSQSNEKKFWFTNETVLGGNNWGTVFGSIHF